MGGHHSKQTLSVSSSVVTDATMNQTQDCIAVTDGQNVVDVFGSGNVVTNVTQDMSFRVKQDCVNKLSAKTDFEQKLSNDVTQHLKDQDIALTSWLTPGSSDQSETIKNSVRTNITTNVVQKCLAQLSGQNVVNVRGTGNVVTHIVQKQSQNVVSSCMQGSQQSMTAITDITNVVNQQQKNVDKNPMAFITDAIQAAVRDVAVAIGIVIVAVVVLVVLGKLLSKRHKKAPPQSVAPIIIEDPARASPPV